MIKKPWAFIRVPYMNPTILGVIGPGFLNQVLTSTKSLCPVSRTLEPGPCDPEMPLSLNEGIYLKSYY